ncbi:MAG: carboxypeptidase regulatory-like domain-containing protein [Chitinophagaceae bacterium]
MKYFLTLLFGLTSLSAISQATQTLIPKGKVIGKILDSITRSPVSFASVSVTHIGNKVPINGALTNEKGMFRITGLAEGRYQLIITFVGYRSQTSASFSIGGGQKSVVNLGNIYLHSTTASLKQITVMGQKNLVENKIDMMVYNAQKDVTTLGGVASDVLQKVPGVSVDVDGNVELQGSSSVKILINGKPSSMFGADMAEALQSIPASEIKKVEVITSPGAKYDAEGTGGILNIVLKSNRAKGINGSFNLSGGTRLENGSFNLNARNGNFGIHGYFNGNTMLSSTSLSGMNRSSFDSTGENGRLLQNGRDGFIRQGYHSGIGFDWEPSKFDNFTTNLGFDHFGFSNSGFTN